MKSFHQRGEIYIDYCLICETICMPHSCPNYLAPEESSELLSILGAYVFNPLDLFTVLEDDRRRELVKRQEILSLRILGDVDRVRFKWVAALVGSSPGDVVRTCCSGLLICKDLLVGKVVDHAFVAVDQAVHARLTVDGSHHFRAAVKTFLLASTARIYAVKYVNGYC